MDCPIKERMTNVKIKLISFSESKLVAMNVSHEVIAEKIKEITGVDENFLFCQTQKEMFTGIKEGIEKANIIVLAVDASRFISTKAALFRALGFKCRLNAEITGLINSDACMATLNENQVNAHAAIPVGGEAFITNDGLFSGFGIESGRQKLIFVPIDERRIGAVLENGMIAFLSKGVEKKPVEEEKVESDIPEEMEGYVQPIENFETPAENTEPQYEEIYRAPEATTEEENEFEDIQSSSYNEEADVEEELPATFEEEVHSENQQNDSLAVLASRGVKVAFARQSENVVYTNILSEIGNSSAVQFVDFAVDKTLDEDSRRKENVASNARKAMKQTNADFAVAMSKIYYDEDGAGYVFATLADVNKASVFKVFSSEDETEEDLYRAGFESILEKINEKTVDVKLVSDGFSSMGEATPTKKNKITPATQIVIWVLVIVALCALSALIIDSVMSSSASLTESSGAIISEINNLLSR